MVCGHSLEVNVTSSLDFYLSVAQVQLLQQLFRDNMVGLDPPEKSAEVRGGTHLGFQLTPVSVLIITVLFEVPQLSQTGCESRAQARDGLDHNSAPSDRL